MKPKMKITLNNLWRARQVFSKILNQPYEDAKLTYTLSKIGKKINSEIDDIDKARLMIVRKYARKDEKGNPKTIFLGGLPQYELEDEYGLNKEFGKFLEQEIELDVWKIPFEVVGICKLTPNDVILLGPFFEEKFEEKMEEKPKVKPKKAVEKDEEEDNLEK